MKGKYTRQIRKKNVRKDLTNLGEDFLNKTQKAKPEREKLMRFAYMKMKDFCSIKHTIPSGKETG